MKTVSQSDVSILTLAIANLKISATINIQWLFTCLNCAKTNHARKYIVDIVDIVEKGQAASTDIASLKV